MGGADLEGAGRADLKEEPPMRPPLRAAIASSGMAAPASIAPGDAVAAHLSPAPYVW